MGPVGQGRTANVMQLIDFNKNSSARAFYFSDDSHLALNIWWPEMHYIDFPTNMAPCNSGSSNSLNMRWSRRRQRQFSCVHTCALHAH